MDGVIKPKVDRGDIGELTETALQPPRGGIAVLDKVFGILVNIQLDHVKLGIWIAGKYTAAGSSVHCFLGTLRSFGMVVAVDGRAAGLGADLVKLVAEKIPVTGNSRFGCWICTMVKEDKSLKAFIDRGETWLVPLRDYRNWMIEMRSTPSARETKRRNGTMYRKPDGTLGLGPFTMETRQEMLRRLLQLEVDTGLSLITIEELKYIDTLWDSEGDLTRRCLVDIYYDVKGTRLPWDDYKVPVFDADVISQIKKLCDECDVEFELIAKLIIEIEANKNYTRSTMVTKAFDKIINQGWLHFDSIEKGLKYEN